MKDLIRMYKILEVYNKELIERFDGLDLEKQQKAFDLIGEFVTITKATQKKSDSLVFEFDFPGQILPVYYTPEEGLMETLQVLIESNKIESKPDSSAPKEKAKNNSNKKKKEVRFGEKKEEEKEEEVYFDCNALGKFDADAKNENPPAKVDNHGDFDLMDFISKSDFGTLQQHNDKAGASGQGGIFKSQVGNEDDDELPDDEESVPMG